MNIESNTPYIQYISQHHIVRYLGENNPLLGSPRTPKGGEEYMLRRKSWSIAGDEAARLCGGLAEP